MGSGETGIIMKFLVYTRKLS